MNSRIEPSVVQKLSRCQHNTIKYLSRLLDFICDKIEIDSNSLNLLINQPECAEPLLSYLKSSTFEITADLLKVLCKHSDWLSWDFLTSLRKASCTHPETISRISTGMFEWLCMAIAADGDDINYMYILSGNQFESMKCIHTVCNTLNYFKDQQLFNSNMFSLANDSSDKLILMHELITKPGLNSYLNAKIWSIIIQNLNHLNSTFVAELSSFYSQATTGYKKCRSDIQSEINDKIYALCSPSFTTISHSTFFTASIKDTESMDRMASVVYSSRKTRTVTSV
jgi:hypothetical protein